jgi:hypothetical protein
MAFPNIDYPEILTQDRAMYQEAPHKISTQFDGWIKIYAR